MASWSQNNTVAGAAVGVIILSLIFILYQAFSGGGGGLDENWIPFPVICRECYYGTTVSVEEDEDNLTIKFPIHFEHPVQNGSDTCPARNSGYPAVYCESCGGVFPFIVEEYKRDMVPEACEECGAGSDSLVVLDSHDKVINLELFEQFNIPADYHMMEEAPLEEFGADEPVE